ncbi:hypothetical protein CLF_109149 [Clonorchis sinensis]|uniref:Fibronectin type-III domain-containing protein n=1 Tax=Clonorchis sinensis TaxID=79923 RepID=G7YSA6_CLOSI|nr:hypothetical protein CLF_109149 [Clonorchis sinensis]
MSLFREIQVRWTDISVEDHDNRMSPRKAKKKKKGITGARDDGAHTIHSLLIDMTRSQTSFSLTVEIRLYFQIQVVTCSTVPTVCADSNSGDHNGRSRELVSNSTRAEFAVELLHKIDDCSRSRNSSQLYNANCSMRDSPDVENPVMEYDEFVPSWITVTLLEWSVSSYDAASKGTEKFPYNACGVTRNVKEPEISGTPVLIAMRVNHTVDQPLVVKRLCSTTDRKVVGSELSEFRAHCALLICKQDEIAVQYMSDFQHRLTSLTGELGLLNLKQPSKPTGISSTIKERITDAYVVVNVSWSHEGRCEASHYNVVYKSVTGHEIYEKVNNKYVVFHWPEICHPVEVWIQPEASGRHGESLNQTVSLDGVPETPTDIVIHPPSRGNRARLVTWNDPSRCKGYPGHRYIVSVLDIQNEATSHIPVSTMSITLDRLDECSETWMGIFAINFAGDSPVSPLVKLISPSAPTAPNDVRFNVDRRTRKIHITWKDTSVCPTTNYTLSDVQKGWLVMTVNREAYLDFGVPCYHYQMHIKGANTGGQGPASDVIRFFTPHNFDAPTNVRVTTEPSVPDVEVSWLATGVCHSTQYMVTLYVAGVIVKTEHVIGIWHDCETEDALLIGGKIIPVCKKLQDPEVSHLPIRGRSYDILLMVFRDLNVLVYKIKSTYAFEDVDQIEPSGRKATTQHNSGTDQLQTDLKHPKTAIQQTNRIRGIQTTTQQKITISSIIIQQKGRGSLEVFHEQRLRLRYTKKDCNIVHCTDEAQINFNCKVISPLGFFAVIKKSNPQQVGQLIKSFFHITEKRIAYMRSTKMWIPNKFHLMKLSEHPIRATQPCKKAAIECCPIPQGHFRKAFEGRFR